MQVAVPRVAEGADLELMALATSWTYSTISAIRDRGTVASSSIVSGSSRESEGRAARRALEHLGRLLG
jgi:hypothetical protein